MVNILDAPFTAITELFKLLRTVIERKPQQSHVSDDMEEIHRKAEQLADADVAPLKFDLMIKTPYTMRYMKPYEEKVQEINKFREERKQYYIDQQLALLKDRHNKNN